MSATMKSLGLDRLTPDERFQLAQELWESVADRLDEIPLTEAQLEELDRRIEAHEKDPDAGSPWEGSPGQAPGVAPLTWSLIVKPAAEDDLAEARTWYEGRQAGLGDEFLGQVEKTFRRILRMPRLFGKIRGGGRIALVDRFPYAVLYRLEGDRIIVLAVSHTRSDPKGWQERR